MQVGSGGPSAHPDVPDHLSANHGLARHHGEAGHVGVAGLHIVAVVDDDLAPVPALHRGRLHGAVGGGPDGRSDGRGDVDAGVELALTVAVDGVLPLAEAAADRPDHRPQRWRVDRQVRPAHPGERAHRRYAVDGVGHGAAHRRVAQAVEGVERLVVAVVGEAGGRIGDQRALHSHGPGRFARRHQPHVAHGHGEFARRQAIERRDLGRQRAQRRRLHVLLVRLLLQVRVVLLQRGVVVAQLVEARRLDQHAGVRPGQPGNRKRPDNCCRYKDIGIVQRNRNLAQAATLIAADKDNVITFFQAEAF